MGEKTKSEPTYMLGTDEQQQWMQKYDFAPRGIGFAEPGICALDDPSLDAYNIAKSSYQIYPDVFNVDYAAKTVGIKKEEVIERMKRMYDERLVMYAATSNVQVCGFGLYYWLVKLREGTPDAAKQKLANWFQAKDDICTGFECRGDFDFYNGNHMRVLDNLLAEVIDPWKFNPEVEFVHLCPIRRNIRESHVNMFDAPKGEYLKLYWGKNQIESLAKIQNKMDLVDLRIIEALNTRRPAEEIFNFKKISDISGLDPKAIKEGIVDRIDVKKTLAPIFYLNWPKLGLTNHIFVIRLFQITPSCRKAQIADELSHVAEFNTVYEFTDSFYDIMVWAYNEISDIDALRKLLGKYEDIEYIKEADVYKQFRRWACRLDDENGFWEETVMTDDFLQDWTEKRTCPTDCCSKEGK